jgi:endo-1,4-beta-xylanase
VATKLTRRAACAGAALWPAGALFAIANELRPLKDIARERGILFGSAIDFPDAAVLRNPDAAALYKRECAVFVPGYQLLWSQNEFIPNTFSFEHADNFAEFAASASATVEGDKIIWNEFAPYWANEVYSRGGSSKAAELVRTHVTQVVGHFKGRFASWIVVNECLDVQGNGRNGLKNVPLYNTLGASALDIAFNAAHAADPGAELTLNEVDLELPFPNNARKRANMLRLIEGMKARNVPIHALGMQSHLRSQWGFDAAQIRRFIAEVAGLGLKIRITELDVDDRGYPTDVKARDAACARLVKDYLNVALDNKSVDMLITWGLVDEHSWLNRPVASMDQYDMRNLRRDGTKHRPLPYDDALQPKPMRQAIADALAKAPQR